MRLMSVPTSISDAFFFILSYRLGRNLCTPTSFVSAMCTFITPSETNLIEFLGANILDDKPFIVMPFLKNGNARHYIREHPDCNRAKIVRFSDCM